jgi:hypothetical protein
LAILVTKRRPCHTSHWTEALSARVALIAASSPAASSHSVVVTHPVPSK